MEPTTKTNIDNVEQKSDVYELFMKLTLQQLRITSYVAVGCQNQEIADSLKLDCRTISVYLFRVFKILGFKSRSEVTRFVNDHVEDFADALHEKERHQS
jgi:DNA-binding NarL/FixJ family response regulator